MRRSRFLHSKKNVFIILVVLLFFVTIGFSYLSTSLSINGNLTVKGDAFTVSFDSHGGTVISPVQIILNGFYGNLPEPTKVGYEFLGWYTEEDDGTQITSYSEINSDITLHAHYEFAQGNLATIASYNAYNSVLYFVQNSNLNKMYDSSIGLTSSVLIGGITGVATSNYNVFYIKNENLYSMSHSSTVSANLATGGVTAVVYYDYMSVIYFVQNGNINKTYTSSLGLITSVLTDGEITDIAVDNINIYYVKNGNLYKRDHSVHDTYVEYIVEEGGVTAVAANSSYIYYVRNGTLYRRILGNSSAYVVDSVGITSISARSDGVYYAKNGNLYYKKDTETLSRVIASGGVG